MILKFIMRLAHDLGMDVVIEGVETQKQLDYLANLGADKIQGYFFSRPLPVPDFKKLLAETNYK
ncbi:MAG: EAL domain-containing protein [Selenomonadaceae bacterium]|nr:EAL domain-containing protein [Selenomonadaceae bacterium]